MEHVAVLLTKVVGTSIIKWDLWILFSENVWNLFPFMKIPEREKSAWKLTFLGKLIQLSVFMIIYLYFFATHISLLKGTWGGEMLTKWGQVEEQGNISLALLLILLFRQ